MKRRDFLRWGRNLFAGAVLAGIPGCGSSSNKPNPDSGGGPAVPTSFPQGVASGDPTSGSVVLWTRAVPGDGGSEAVILNVEVSDDAGFGNIVVHMDIMAAVLSDFTVRVMITGLASNTPYYYRFTAPAARPSPARRAPHPTTATTCRSTSRG